MSHCHKCNQTDVGDPVPCSGSPCPKEKSSGKILGEHLHRECPVCGYISTEDKEEKPL